MSDHRARFLQMYFERLNEHCIGYCVARGHERIQSNPEKDIDLMMKPGDYSRAKKLFSNLLKEFDGIEICSNSRGKSLYLKAVFCLDSGLKYETVYIHAIAYALVKTSAWQINKKGIGRRVWFTDLELIKEKVCGIDVYIPSPPYQVLLLVARYLQYPKISYLNYCQKLFTEKWMVKWLNTTGMEEIAKQTVYLSDETLENGMLYKLVGKLWQALIGSSRITHLFDIWTLLLVNIINVFQRRGLLIFFSGPDGSGKTTANNALSRVLTHNLSIQVINIKHLYPLSMCFSRQIQVVQAKVRRIDARESDRLERDRGKSVKWKLRRLLGLVILLLQIWPGYVWARYKNCRGFSVIVDTSFFDVFIKGHRPGFHMLERIVIPLIPCGDVWFLMKADADKIVQRKPELTVEEIKEYYKRLDNITAYTNCIPLKISSEEGVENTLAQILLNIGKQ